MKLLLDECVNQHLRTYILGHDVFSAGFMGWCGVKNGNLLRRAASAGFDALVTTDGSIQHQHNHATLPLAVVWMDAVSNDLDDLLPLIPSLLAALEVLTPRTIVNVVRL